LPWLGPKVFSKAAMAVQNSSVAMGATWEINWGLNVDVMGQQPKLKSLAETGE